MAASSASDFVQNVVTNDDILKATKSPGTLVKNDDWRLDMQKVNKDGTLNIALQANKRAKTAVVREIAKGNDTTVSYIKWDPTSQSSCPRISQRDHLKSEAAFARVALEMKYSNPIKPEEKTEAAKLMEPDTVWDGNHAMKDGKSK